MKRVICSTKEGIIIWYVLYCPKGNEEEIIASCKQHMARETLRDAFLITYDRMLRYQGEWHVEKRKMFPGYMFLESEDGELLMKELERYEDIVQILGDRLFLVPITSKEEHFLKGLLCQEHHMGLSKGYIRDGRTFVTEGPLCGKEEWIRKIDRHKRLAKLEIPYGKPLPYMNVGLEIVGKN